MADSSSIRTIPNNYTRYERLDTNRKEIRLLRVIPGDDDEDLVVELYRTHLSNCPSYQALSYCWGSLEATKPITLVIRNSKFIDSSKKDVQFLDDEETSNTDGAVLKGFKVTTNLHAALISFRRSHTTRFIWVDSLCICQGDLVERSSQVALMKDIYSQARLTVVWLGNDVKEMSAWCADENAELSLFMCALADNGMNNNKHLWNLVQEFNGELVALEKPVTDIFDAINLFTKRRIPPSSAFRQCLKNSLPNIQKLLHSKPLTASTRHYCIATLNDEEKEAVEQNLAVPTQLFLIWLHSIFLTPDSPEEEQTEEELEAVMTYLSRVIFDRRSEVWAFAEYAVTCTLVHEPRISPERISTTSSQRLNTISSNSWFTRIWVLQEVFSNSIVRVRIGEEETDFNAIDALWSLERDRVLTTTNHPPENSEEIISAYDSIKWIPAGWSDILKRHSKLSPQLPLWTIVKFLGHFDATEPRDMIFATYHLATDVSLDSFRPDYEANLSDVFTQFTRRIIESTGNAHILLVHPWIDFDNDISTTYTGMQMITGCPSWVPDYRLKLEMPGLGKYKASGPGNTEVIQRRDSPRTNPSMLSLQGFHISQVTHVFDPHTVQTHLSNPLPALWAYLDYIYFHLFGRWSLHPGPTYREDHGQDPHLPFTVFAEAIFQPESESEVPVEWLASVWSVIDPNLQYLEKNWRYAQIMRREISKRKQEEHWSIISTATMKSGMLLKNRKCFFSDRGRLGLCPSSTNRGDLVVGIFGCEYPLILRRKRNTTEFVANRAELVRQEDEYELIGDCYLNGDMQGEVIEHHAWGDALYAEPTDVDPLSSRYCQYLRSVYSKQFFNIV